MTKPIDEILPRKINPEIAQILSNFSDLIDEVVNYGTHILKWLVEESKGGDEQMPIFMFFRDMLEKADAISILINNSSVDPAKGILRSLFETHLYISYLIEDHFHDRSMAFIVWENKKKIQLNRTFDPNDQEYKNFKKKIENDSSIYPSYTSNLLNKIPSVKPILDNLNSLLERPEYIKVVKEFEKTKNKNKVHPAWYSLFNGPRNIQQLASHLKMASLYEVVYRSWSGSVHGTDIINGKIVKSKNSIDDGDKVAADLIQIRLPKDAQSVIGYTLILIIKTYTVLMDKKIPIKKMEYMKWYITIRDQILIVTDKDPIIKIDY